MSDDYRPLAGEASEGGHQSNNGSDHGVGGGGARIDSSDFSFRYLDDALSYETQKVVVIRDRRLGFLYYALCSAIFGYVVIWQILYCNEHFPRKDVTGTSRLVIQQPTQGFCDPDNVGCLSDFQKLEDLPYCKEYTKGEKREDAKPCVFADRNSIAPNGMLEAHLLIPTQVTSTIQNKGCEPSSSNEHSCENEYDINGTSQTAYVADIERYMVHLSHTYTRIHSEDEGTNEFVRGYYLQCHQNEESGLNVRSKVYGVGQLRCDGKVERKEIECLTEECPFLKDDDGKSFVQQAASLVTRGRKLGASLLLNAAESLDPDEEHRKHVSKSETPGPHHGHHHRHRKKLVRTPYEIDAKGTIHLDKADGAKQEPQKDATKLHAAASGKVLLETKRHQAHENPGARGAGVWGEAQGDVITVQKILELCDLTLDGTLNHDGTPLRQAGTVIEIEAFYTNLHPWVSSFGDTTVEYEYRVTRRPVEKFSNSVFSKFQPNFPAQRIIEERTGLYVIVKIGGEFGHFSLVYCMVLIASAAGLMRVATVLVDKVAIYVMQMKEVYADSKYQLTERVYDMQKNLDWLANMEVSDVDAVDAVDDAPEMTTTRGSLREAAGQSSTGRASTDHDVIAM